MARFWCMVGVMGGLASDIFPVRRDVDDQMDEAESLPNRYQNILV
jgi:hypothetical protein